MESPRVFSYKIPAVWPAGISCISQTRLRSLRPLTPAYTRLRPLTPPGLGHSARRARNPLETRLNKTRRAGRPFLRAQTRGQPKNGTLAEIINEGHKISGTPRTTNIRVDQLSQFGRTYSVRLKG